MKISTRQYLKDLEKAEQKGRNKGIVEREESEVMNNRLQHMAGRIERLTKRVEQLGRTVEMRKEALDLTCGGNPDDTLKPEGRWND